MFVCVLALVPVSWGQRGGGFHAAGGFASHGSMHSGGMSFAHAHPGFSSSNGWHSAHGPVFVTGAPVHTHGFHQHGFHHGHFVYPYAAYPYSYGYGAYGWPFWWDWSSSYDDSRDDYRAPYNDAQYQTAAEINRLADEVQDLRQDRYNQPAPTPAAAVPRPEAKLEQPDLPVVLVFLDRHIQEVKNYAVANEMLVVLDGNRRTKYPLADIDLAATMKLNDERGVDFEVPNPVITQ